MAKYKLIPESLMTLKGYSSVARIVAHQPHSKEHGCIRPELVAVECIMVNGCTRWYGFEHAYITSSLRMAVSGWNPRDEVVSKWEDWSER